MDMVKHNNERWWKINHVKGVAKTKNCWNLRFYSPDWIPGSWLFYSVWYMRIGVEDRGRRYSCHILKVFSNCNGNLRIPTTSWGNGSLKSSTFLHKWTLKQLAVINRQMKWCSESCTMRVCQFMCLLLICPIWKRTEIGSQNMSERNYETNKTVTLKGYPRTIFNELQLLN